jgi:ABC-type glutathione transport system ATPase component
MRVNDDRSDPLSLIVGVVGPCCAGKSTLVKALLERGYAARHIAQEHSFAPRMWQIIGKAEVLVYLDVSFSVAQQRRWMDWQPADLEEQGRRLRHAREHCDLYLQTDALRAEDVLERVLTYVSA